MEQTFHYLLLSNQAMLHKQLLSSLAGSGLTLGQPKILDYLGSHDGSNQKEIAAACHMEAGSLSSVLTGMEHKGLITRERKGSDKRSLYVFLTEEGWSLQNVVANEFLRLEQQAFSGISKQEQDAFMELFLQISHNLSNPPLDKE